MTPGQGQGQAAAATATPQAATAGASGSRRGAGTAAAAPPKKQAADWPRRRRTSHDDWLPLSPRLRPPTAEPGLTDRRGQVAKGVPGGGASLVGVAWHDGLSRGVQGLNQNGRRRCEAAATHVASWARRGAGNNGEGAGEGEKAEVFQCLVLSVFTRGAAWPAVKK